MTTSDSTIPKKTCSKCGVEYPATEEYFRRNPKGKYGLRGRCKICDTIWRNEHQTELRLQGAVSYLKHREETLAKAREYRLNNHDKTLLTLRNSYRKYREERLKNEHEKYWNDPEEGRKKSRESYARTRARYRFYVKTHADQYRVYNQKRQARKRELIDTFSQADWQYALNFFHGCCAICGRPLKDLFGAHTASADHWIPITSPDCPGTVPWNILPLCHGVNGCNNRKSDKDPRQWVLDTFGKRKGNAILKRIDEYFTSVS